MRRCGPGIVIDKFTLTTPTNDEQWYIPPSASWLCQIVIRQSQSHLVSLFRCIPIRKRRLAVSFSSCPHLVSPAITAPTLTLSCLAYAFRSASLSLSCSLRSSNSPKFFICGHRACGERRRVGKRNACGGRDAHLVSIDWASAGCHRRRRRPAQSASRLTDSARYDRNFKQSRHERACYSEGFDSHASRSAVLELQTPVKSTETS